MDRRSDRDLIEETLERVRSLERGKEEIAQELLIWLLWRQAFNPGEEIRPLMEAIDRGELSAEIFNLRSPKRSLIKAVADGEVPVDAIKIDEEAVEAAIE